MGWTELVPPRRAGSVVCLVDWSRSREEDTEIEAISVARGRGSEVGATLVASVVDRTGCRGAVPLLEPFHADHDA